VETVWNCPLRDEVAGPRTSPPQARLRLLYHGSIVPSRLPMAVVDALARVESATLGIAGYETAGHPGYVAALLARARTRGLEDRVTWTGTLPTRTALLAHADGFDVGLALMPSQTADLNEQTMLGASNKPFDYLARGLALLVGDRPDWVETYVEAGVARRCQPSSIADIAAALRTFAEQPADTRAMGERGRQRILADWNYERTFARVVEVMARATQTAAAPATLHSPAGTDARRR
jgi:glycosyltransferase involved in cell wall biosynthesis